MADLLRFMTAGSVDDGKSTLIGRLLYDADALYDDHIEAMSKGALCNNGSGFFFSDGWVAGGTRTRHYH